jgi:isoleucyl-tRNA synthetase
MAVLDDSGAPDGRALLVWTTTPWTLVSNVALAVNPELEYAEVEHEGKRLVLASARVRALFGEEATVARTFAASELVGLRYRRPFEWVEAPDRPEGARERAWRVVPGDFV